MKKLAYAKVNLFLNCKGELENGFHDLEMVNIMVGLADEIEYTLTDSEITCDTSILDLNGKNNLSFKVAQYMKKKYQVSSGVKIYIDKHIPVGGGLGGGSSDAATTIEALNELWGLNLSFEEMFDIATKYGSDTAYCLYKGPAIVRGIGFDIEPLDLDITNYEISLFNPKINVSTGNVFSSLVNYNKYSLEEALKYLKSGKYEEFIKGLKNDLMESVFILYPEVEKEYNLLKRIHGEEGLFMSGTGSTFIKINIK